MCQLSKVFSFSTIKILHTPWNSFCPFVQEKIMSLSWIQRQKLSQGESCLLPWRPAVGEALWNVLEPITIMKDRQLCFTRLCCQSFWSFFNFSYHLFFLVTSPFIFLLFYQSACGKPWFMGKLITWHTHSAKRGTVWLTQKGHLDTLGIWHSHTPKINLEASVRRDCPWSLLWLCLFSSAYSPLLRIASISSRVVSSVWNSSRRFLECQCARDTQRKHVRGLAYTSYGLWYIDVMSGRHMHITITVHFK